jgi:hypothetical protein
MPDDHEPEPTDDERMDLIGPFERHDVLIGGRAVPFLHAKPMDGGKVDLTLDRRFGLLLSVAEAERFVPFLAHAIAVALGYAAHPDANEDPSPRLPFPQVRALI